MQLASRIYEAEDLEAAVEICYQNRWTDGLPEVPKGVKAARDLPNLLNRT